MPAFTEDQWRKILDRLTVYAQRKFVRLGWKSKNGYRTPHGQGPEDIASEAIVRIIENKRVYNAQRCPDFEQFLRGCVDSIISYIINSPDFKKREAMPCITTSEGETEEIEPEGRDIDPLQICIEKDIVEKVKSILKENFAEDIIVSGIYECLNAGIDKRSEQAEYLGVDVKEIDNAQKRLQRAVNKNLQK